MVIISKTVGEGTLCCYRPQRSWAKVIFSQACVCSQRGCLPQCMLGYTPPSRHPPTSRHPPEQTPPREADFSIRSTSGLYASYWKAFLFDSVVCDFSSFHTYSEGNFFSFKVRLHVPSLSQCPSPSPSKLIIVPVVMDSLMDRLGSEPMLSLNIYLTVIVTGRDENGPCKRVYIFVVPQCQHKIRFPLSLFRSEMAFAKI